jgi:fatty acid synthase subunit beta
LFDITCTFAYSQVKEKDKFVSSEKKLFPHIDEFTASYDFQHPDGLLFATQFSQPALVLVELSSFRDMLANGLVPSDCVFAGT